MSDYDEIRSNLLSMLEELNDRLGKIIDDVKHVDQAPEKDFEEQAVHAENDEVLDFLGNRARSEIAQIQDAIARIDAGHYGTCQSCGEPIASARLKVLPYSDLCIKCASQQGC